ncbi:hypothetical protein GCM10022393_15490 [Aquimarina addita]|uniref:Uncharacterized protein n=1 Tax=Aquimarina addita TaxID=870485 RepID=A0ABP7XH20_9FLAO
MIKELSLDSKQEKIVAKINLKYTVKLKELMLHEGFMIGKIREIKDIKKGKNAELITVLSEDQLEKYKDQLESQIKSCLKNNMKR